MKKSFITLSVMLNVVLIISLLYILNLKYYDNYYDRNGNWHNEEHKIVELIRLVIKEQGGIIVWN